MLGSNRRAERVDAMPAHDQADVVAPRFVRHTIPADASPSPPAPTRSAFPSRGTASSRSRGPPAPPAAFLFSDRAYRGRGGSGRSAAAFQAPRPAQWLSGSGQRPWPDLAVGDARPLLREDAEPGLRTRAHRAHA